MISFPLLLIAAAAPCISVTGDQVLARDLVAIIPEFATVAPGSFLGYAPIVGVKRYFQSNELARFAAKFGVVVQIQEPLCVERASTLLDPSGVRNAMQASLSRPDARIEVVELCKSRVPLGQLEFPLSGLSSPSPAQPEAAVRWRGHVRYGGDRVTSVWALVRLRVPSVRFVANEDLKAGDRIAPSQIRADVQEEFPDFRFHLRQPEDLDGWVLRKPFRAGSTLDLRALDPPIEIERGQKVQMELRSEGLLMKFDAVAESAGRRGQIIWLKSPLNGKRLAARVEGRGRVSR